MNPQVPKLPNEDATLQIGAQKEKQNVHLSIRVQHLYTYIMINSHIYALMHTHICIYTYIDLYMFSFIHMHILMHVCLQKYIDIDVCQCIHLYICAYIYIKDVYLHTCTQSNYISII